MSGVSIGSFMAIFAYALVMAGLAYLISLFLKKRLTGFLLVLVSVSLMAVIILTLAAMGMAQSDFTFKFAAPIFGLSVAIGICWLAILRSRESRNG